jgi:hypothetical protein
MAKPLSQTAVTFAIPLRDVCITIQFLRILGLAAHFRLPLPQNTIRAAFPAPSEENA